MYLFCIEYFADGIVREIEFLQRWQTQTVHIQQLQSIVTQVELYKKEEEEDEDEEEEEEEEEELTLL